MMVDRVGEARRTTLTANRFLLDIQRAASLRFLVQGEVLNQWAPERMASDALRRLRVDTELLQNLTALEEVTGQVIGSFTRPMTVLERIRLRQTRLLWQGRVVQWDRALPPMVSPDGVVPRAVRIPATVFDAGGARGIGRRSASHLARRRVGPRCRAGCTHAQGELAGEHATVGVDAFDTP